MSSHEKPKHKKCPEGSNCCASDHILNPATDECVDKKSHLGQILMRNSNKKHPHIPSESSFPAYADQVVREQLSAVSSRLERNNHATDKIAQRLEESMAHAKDFETLKTRVSEHDSRVETISELERIVQGLSQSVQNINEELRPAIELNKRNAEENEELKRSFSSVSDVAEKLGIMRKELLDHAMKVEEVSKSIQSLYGVEERIKEDVKIVTHIRESMALTSSASSDALHAASHTKEQAEALKSEVHKSYLLVEETRKALQSSLDDSNRKQSEIQHFQSELKNEMMAVRSSIQDLESRALGAVQEMAESMLKRISALEDSAINKIESAARAEMSHLESSMVHLAQEVKHLTESEAKSVEEVMVKAQHAAEQAASSAIAAVDAKADQTIKLAHDEITSIERHTQQLDDAAKHLEAERIEAHKSAKDTEALIHSELKKVDEILANVKSDANKQIEAVQSQVSHIEQQLSNEASHIVSEAHAATEKLAKEESAAASREIHVEHNANLNPEHDVLLDRATQEAKSIHKNVVILEATLEEERKALEVEQQLAQTHYEVAEQLRSQANAAAMEETNEMRQIAALNQHLNAQQSDAAKHPNSEAALIGMQQTQNAIQQLESNVQIIHDRASQLADQYQAAAQTVNLESAQLESHGAQYQTDKNTLDVKRRQQLEADALLREASTAYHTGIPSADNSTRPMTSTEQILGHYLPHDAVDPLQSRRPPIYDLSLKGGSHLTDTQRREIESNAMRSLTLRKISPMSHAYKTLMAYVRKEADNNKAVLLDNETIEKVIR